MEEDARLASALARPAHNYTTVVDTFTSLAVEAGEADGEIGESDARIVGDKALGFRKIAWIGGAFIVSTVVGAFVFKRTSTTMPQVPSSVTQLQALKIGAPTLPPWPSSWLCGDDDAQAITIASGLNLTISGCAEAELYCESAKHVSLEALCPATCGLCTVSEPDPRALLLLKSVRSAYYLHVSSWSLSNEDPVFHRDSTTDGSKWQVERVGSSGLTIMLKNVRSGDYLHVSSWSMKDGDRVLHSKSTSDGSKWQVEHIGSSASAILLKSVRSGFYLHVSSEKPDSGDPVFHAVSASAGSKWLLEWQNETDIETETDLRTRTDLRLY